MTAHPFPTTFDPADPTVRSDAEKLSQRLQGDSRLEAALRSMLDAVAHGSRVVIMQSEEEVTPSGAAELMGVTRQFVDRLCEDGVLPFRRLPNSRHRRIRVADVLEVTAERERRRAGGNAIRSALKE